MKNKRNKSVAYQAVIHSPIGKLGIQTDDEYLFQIGFLASSPIDLQSPSTFVAELTCDQLTKYFKNPSHIFELTCELNVTPFQNRILNEICLIPVGQTLDYGTIAKKARTGPRAIGMVCRTNPLPLVIPCHRVTAKQGIGGFGGVRKGPAIAIKEWLLNHEKSVR